ncbi:MAG: hypothetical protein NZ927_05290 [Candidatus Calescibacterium sp.]|nr:hypothetical protein [Candidatus Calescibacterium sp.]MCX7733219.1 hypothetical protein [bacterium]MDW8086926.1 hypothetical protein [Candidatus Calescibacterium sp.]
MSYDIQPLVTIEEKKKILKRAVEEGWILFFEHDPFSDCATVKVGRKYIEIETRLNISDLD